MREWSSRIIFKLSYSQAENLARPLNGVLSSVAFNDTLAYPATSGLFHMIIGDRLRALREQKNLSQGHIEKRTGLLRCYLSRVECGHTVPSIETLEKWARALEVPLYQIFYEGENPPAPLQRIKANGGLSRADARFLMQMRRALSRTKETDRQLLLAMARKLAKGKAA
jgi:transcriptional regulator with XRE-family HTH domain